jgi:hypothetical protein
MSIQSRSDDTGLTLYITLRNAAQQFIVSSTGAAEAYATAHWSKYIHVATELTPGNYVAEIADSLPAGDYRIEWRYQSGSSAAPTDEVRRQDWQYWDEANWSRDMAVKHVMAENPISGSMEAAVADAAKPGDKMDLVDSPNSAALAAIATQVESQIINESDGKQVLQAIISKINAIDPNLPGLTTTAIAASVWAATERTLTEFGFTVKATTSNNGEFASQASVDTLQAAVGSPLQSNDSRLPGTVIAAKTDVAVAITVNPTELSDASLEAIDTQLSSTHGSGTWGLAAPLSVVKTVSVVNSSGAIVVGAEVYSTSDAAGQDVIAGPYLSDASGVATCPLPQGVQHLWCFKAGETFSNNGQKVTIAASESDAKRVAGK